MKTNKISILCAWALGCAAGAGTVLALMMSGCIAGGFAIAHASDVTTIDCATQADKNGQISYALPDTSPEAFAATSFALSYMCGDSTLMSQFSATAGNGKVTLQCPTGCGQKNTVPTGGTWTVIRR